MQVALSSTGLAKLGDKALRRAKFMSEGMRPALEEMARDALQQMQAQVRGGNFKQLSDGYEKERSRAGYNGPPLDRTGKLLASMSPSVARRPSHWAIQISFSGDHGKGLSNAALANVQRFGTRGNSRRLREVRSARRYLPALERNQTERAHLATQLQGVPARNFLKLPSAWRAAWRAKLKAQLNSL